MPVTDLCIELRPNLFSGVVSIAFDEILNARSATRILLKEKDLHIQEPYAANSELIMRYGTFGMNIEQITAFSITGKHINFRFNYQHIDVDALDKNSLLVSLQPIQLQFEESQMPIAIYCRNCHVEFMPSTTYRRLREFPTCLFDPAEFFCHAHGPQSHGQSPLVPKPDELFYGLNHIIINAEGLRASHKQALKLHVNGNVFCARCMCLLGHTILDGSAAKIWADTLYWRSAETTATVYRPIFKHSSLSQLMLHLLNTVWPLPHSCVNQMRFILQAQLPDPHNRYMLIHVLEPQLRVLRRAAESVDKTQLYGYMACKLYYRVFEESNVPLLQQWQSKADVPQLTISPRKLLELQDHLEENTRLVPSACRFNSTVEQLVLSYFFYEDNNNEEKPPATPLRQRKDSLSSMSDIANETASQHDSESDCGLSESSDDEDITFEKAHGNQAEVTLVETKPQQQTAIVTARTKGVTHLWPPEA